MPAIVGILWQGVQYMWGKYFDRKAANAYSAEFRSIAAAIQGHEQLASFFAYCLERAVQGAVNSRGAVVNSFSQIGGAISEHNIAMRHIVDTIIPASINHAIGREHAKTVAPLVARLKGDEKSLAATRLTANTLNNWRKQTGDPWLNWLRKWHDTQLPSITSITALWVGWLRNPAGFGDWATPPIVGNLIAYWADPSHQPTRDALMLIVIRAMQDAPMDVQTAFEQWLVTESN